MFQSGRELMEEENNESTPITSASVRSVPQVSPDIVSRSLMEKLALSTFAGAYIPTKRGPTLAIEPKKKTGVADPDNVQRCR